MATECHKLITFQLKKLGLLAYLNVEGRIQTSKTTEIRYGCSSERYVFFYSRVVSPGENSGAMKNFNSWDVKSKVG